MNERMEQEIQRTLQALQDYLPPPSKQVLRRRTGTKRRAALRRGAAALLAAAAVLCLSGAAYALFQSDWLSRYFFDRSLEGLTSGQLQFIEEKRVDVNQTADADGYTVSIHCAICDAQNLFLTIRIEGPEGVRLDLPKGEGNCSFGTVRLQSTETAPDAPYPYSRGWRRIDDGDGLDNTTTLLLNERRVLSGVNGGAFTDGAVWTLRLEKLRLRTGEYYTECRELAEGGWEFAFPLSELSGEIEFVSAPVACTAQSGGEGAPKTETDIWLDSFRLTPFGADCSYRFSDERVRCVDFMDVWLVQKNGGKIRLRPSMGGGSPFADGVGSMSYIFDVPVVLEEIAYLELPGDVRLPVPAG